MTDDYVEKWRIIDPLGLAGRSVQLEPHSPDVQVLPTVYQGSIENDLFYKRGFKA